MSGTSSPQGGLTRRSFLKTTGTVAGVAALGATTPTLTALAEDTDTQNQEDHVFCGACRPNCFSSCKIDVHVRDGKVVKTSRGHYPDPSKDRICLRGLSNPIRIYDGKRIGYPLKRAGERGADQWERISWETAIDEISSEIKRIQNEYGPQGMTYMFTSGQYGLAKFQSPYQKLFNSLHFSFVSPSIDLGNMVAENNCYGWGNGNWVGNEASDYVNAKTLFLWSNNITDAQVQEWHFVVEAMKGGTKLIVIDPTFTNSAAKADLWVPVKPGTDAALILGMMNIQMRENLVNIPYIKAHTVAPFLVRSDTGGYLLRSDTGVEPTPTGVSHPITGKEVMYDPKMVLDADGGLVSVDEAKDPSVTGVYDFDGVACNTAFDLLRARVMEYSPEKASEITTVQEAVIHELAYLATDGPVTHRIGWGNQFYLNGVHPTFACCTMAGLLGQIGFPGAGCGCADITSYPGINSAYVSSTGASSGTIMSVDFPEVVMTGKLRGNDFPIRGIFNYTGNPVCTGADTNAVLDAFSKMELVVTVDSTMNDTSRYADYVLPCAGWFEQEDITPQSQTRYLVYNEKAIEPLYESKTDFDIAVLLAHALDKGDVLPATYPDYLKHLFDTKRAQSDGISYERIKEEKAVRWTKKDPYIAWEDSAFLTGTGRVEFYWTNPVMMGVPDADYDLSRDRLPNYFPSAQATEDDPSHPFVLMSKRPRFRVHSQWFDNPWLRELDPEPTVEINPRDAVKYGIESGDYVECINDLGHCVAKAVLSEGVRPGTLVYAKSWQINQHKAGCWSELAHRIHEPIACNTGFMDIRCEIRPWSEGGR